MAADAAAIRHGLPAVLGQGVVAGDRLLLAAAVEVVDTTPPEVRAEALACLEVAGRRAGRGHGQGQPPRPGQVGAEQGRAERGGDDQAGMPGPPAERDLGRADVAAARDVLVGHGKPFSQLLVR